MKVVPNMEEFVLIDNDVKVTSVSVTAPDDDEIILEDNELLDFFHENGLDAKKWSPIFIEADILSFSDICRIKDKNNLDQLITHANIKEKEIFSQLLLILDNTTDFSQAELTLEVTKIGFDDANYWIPILNKYFGVRSKLGLQCLGPDSYLILNQFSRSENETAIIKKICEVPLEHDYDKWQDKIKEKIDLRVNKLKLLYTDLVKIKDSKSVSNDLIKQNFNQYLELMQKSELHFDKNHERTEIFHLIFEKVKTTINYMEEYKTKSDENLNETKIKQLVNQCLGGILISDSLNDQCKQREFVLKFPEDIRIQPPMIPEIVETNLSFTLDEELSFKSCLENLGYSITHLIDSKGFYGSHSDKEYLNLSEEKKIPVSASDYNIVPVASCMIDIKNLNFCSDAISKLKSLEDILLQPKRRAAAIQKLCEDFFNVYGSHVFFGRIHFGGIFMSKQEPHEYENNFQEGKDFGLTEANYLNEIRKEIENQKTDICSFETDADYSTPTKVTVYGGSHKELIFSPWRHSLKTDMKFWKVVDKGCNLIPVWEILKLNHATEFRDVNLLSECLTQGWERFVKIESNLPLYIETINIDKEVDCIVSQLGLWMSNEDQLSSCENNLSLLMQFKEDLHFRTKDPLAFARMILTHPNMHEYINNLASLTEKFPLEEARRINFLIRHVVSGSCYVGVDFSLKSSEEFSLSPNIFVLQHFEDFLKKLHGEFQMICSKETSDCIPTPMKEIIKAVQNLSCTLKYTFSELSKYEHTYGELLLMLILIPLDYSHQCNLFHHWYHKNTIQHILDNIKYFEKLSVYKSEVEVQAFILHLCLSLASDKDDKQKLTCDAFKHFLQEKLHSHISELLECNDDFEKLITELSNLFLGVDYRNKFGEKSLNSVSSFEDIFMFELDQIEQDYAELDLKDYNELKQVNEKSVCILRDLHLEEVMSYNFGMKDILTVKRISLKGEEPQTLKEEILNIISKQIMLDYRSRDIKLCIASNHLDETTKSLQCDKNKTELEIPENVIQLNMDENVDLDSIMMELVEEPQQKTPDLLHPSDVNVIIMNCCDNILRQILVQKMAICQLAIPLVLPNLHNSELVFNLWAMRLLNMKWKTQLKGAQDMNAVDYPTPIVSAIRLGDLSRSKSQMLNNLLCHQPHDIYFHRDCNGGNLSRRLSDGVVELAWYLPGGKKDDNFDNVMALANLRADAKNYSKQFDLLCKISSVMLIFLSLQSISDPECSAMLEKLSTSNQQLVFIFLGTVSPISYENQIKNFSEFKKLMGNKKFKTVLGSVKGQVKNSALLTTELRKHINVYLQSSYGIEGNTEQLNWNNISDIARCSGIKVDEDSKSCLHGKKMANIIINDLQSKNVTTIKEEVLPLQGHLWSEWSRLSKMQARMDGVLGKDQEAYISELHAKKKVYRKKQYNLVEKMNPVMKIFIQNLIQTKDNPEFRTSFMQWMKLKLDDISHKELPELQMMYHSLWNGIQEQKIKKLNDSLIRMTQNQLDEVERNLIATSFGLEHFMREIGQVYEALIEHDINTSDKSTNLYLLPQFAADLLISGFPLEIMDGDASHMPLTWVKAVFDRLKVVLGDKKLYVISVLGVQSSGKSTLLNTMFGLNFAVSAGRCTKGVFAQLIPVDNNLNVELGYDFILVLDTEGLRAPELGKSKLNHDNELAALVIGMGDVTILNIKGENTAEIEDILQISVHAFLRMRLVNKILKLQPGCYFVHQNVPAVNAAEKMLYGYKKLQEQLDVMTIAAAEQEHASEIQSFRDVIEFDVKNNVWHFSSLWQGDPPMAPANPSYSEKVLDLKTNLLKYPSQKNITCLTITERQHRMSDLWNAILYENFVFSFKNSLEVKSYSILEEKFSLLSWNFRNEVKKWIHGSINEILSCEEKNVIKLHGLIISSLLTCMEENFSKCKTELEDFFLSAREKDVLVQWKSNIELKLKSLSDELKNEAMKTCERHFEMRSSQFDQEKQTNSYQKQLQVFVKELVSTNVEEKMSNESLNKMFDEKWKDWIKILHFEQSEQENDVTGDVLTILPQHFKKYNNKLQIVIAQYEPLVKDVCDLDILPKIDEEDYVPKSSFSKRFSYYAQVLINQMDPIIAIQKFTYEILNKIKSYLNEKKNQDYDKTFIYEICNLVQEKIAKYNSGSQPYALHINYSLKVTVYILRNVIPYFKNMQQQYRKKNDPLHILEDNFKPQLQKLFHGTYSQCMQEKTAADILSTSLEKAILVSLKRDLPRKIAENFTTSHSEFHTKLRLYAKVMEDLGTFRDFDKYLQFINDPNKSMESWLKVYVCDFCSKVNENGISNLGNAAIEILQNTVSTLVNCVKEVKVSVNANEISFQIWLQRYHTIAKRIVPLSDALFNILDLQQVKDVNYFEEMIILGLKNVQTNLEQFFRTWSLKELDNLEEKPHRLIAENILGCTKQCPFCRTICINTIADHASSHSAPLHQPQGVAGYRHLESQKLILNSCNLDVAGNRGFICCDTSNQTHLYKEYKTVNEYYASWSISPDTSLEASAYWKWVFCQFSTQFAEYHQANCPEIPSTWLEITWKDAKKSIWKSCYL